MKKSKLILLIIALSAIYTSCNKGKDDYVPITSATILTSFKATTSPVVDGVIDQMWDNVDKLTNVATVPSAGLDEGNPGWDVFEGVVDDSYNFTMRSMYDDNNIYFLVEYDDPTESLDRQSWYFDTANSTWTQEDKHPSSPDSYGKWYYEDKFAIQWNIGNSVAGWDAATCFTSCHTDLDYAAHGDRSARHYTNGPNELIDVWHWKGVRTNFENQIDDKHFNDDEFGGDGGRHGDSKISGGYSNNKQSLELSDMPGVTVKVPKYFIPGSSNYYWITKVEIDGGIAKMITAVDSNGILTYDGGTVDPSNGGFEQGVGVNRMPSVTISPFIGGRGDITAHGVHTGSGWVLEFSRALTTADAGTEDVSFDTSKEFLFGLSIFDNVSIAHAIKTELRLKFKP